MGLFSSKYVTQVGTSVARVIKDNLLPNSVKMGTINAVLKNIDITDNILEETINSIGVKAERLYEYGKTTYSHGLPSGSIFSNVQGREEVIATLNRLENTNILLEYSRLAPINLMHNAWVNLIPQYLYDPATNELTSLEATTGYKTYLKDITIVIPASKKDTYEPSVLAQWGIAPNAGYTPERLANTGGINPLQEPSTYKVDSTAQDEYAVVTYVWEALLPTQIEGVMIDKPYILEDTSILNLTGFKDDTDYFQVKYQANGVSKYWTYELGAGTYPLLDNIYNSPVVSGEYFPMLYFRYAKKATNADTASDEYKTSKRLAKYLGMDFDEVASAIDENPDIKDVEQAMLVFAVPANTENEIEQRYLYEYFDNVFYSTEEQLATQQNAVIQSNLNKTTEITKHTVVIQDKKFKLSLSNGGIYKKRVVGNIGKIGAYSSGFEQIPTTIYVFDVESNAELPIESKTDIHYYRKQISETLYDEIRIVNLKVQYYVFEGYYTTGDDDDKILLIPIDRTVTEKFSIPDRELLYARSLHFVFNSRVVTKLKWYQQSWFSAFLTILAIAFTIWTLGTDGGQLISAIVAGSSGALTGILIALVILDNVITGLVVSYLAKLFVKAIGLDLAFLLAVLGALYGLYKPTGVSSILGAPWATDLLKIASGLAKAIGDVVTDDYKTLLKEIEDFKSFTKEQNELLENANALLENRNSLEPLIVFGESPDEFYNRTVHSGNIGLLGINAISSYVERSLMLPTFSDTIGDIQNG